MSKKKDITAFEPSLKRLEAIVLKLEDGALPLEDSLALFEEGVGLSRQCLETLNRAEQKVEQLTAQSGVQPMQQELPEESP
ncbi:MAG: exodeoxyribonuclease VII small subunit [Leptospirillia bacterium]